MFAFVLAVVFVFLVLAAQFESLTLPLAVILIVPMCLVASITGVVLAVRASLSQPVSEGGIMISSYTGVSAVSAVAVGAHHSGFGSGSTITVADAGAIPVGTGALTYGVTMSNGLAGRDPPPGFLNIVTQSSGTMVTEGDYAVQTSAGTVDPRWTWYFSSPSSWLATGFTLNPPLHLGFTVQPSTTLPLLPIQPAVQVTVLDAFGNRNTIGPEVYGWGPMPTSASTHRVP